MGACTLSHLKNGRGGGIVAAQSTSNRLCKYLSLNLMSNSAFTIYKIDSPASPRIPIGNRYGGPSTTNISVVCLKSHGTTSLWNLIKYATDQALGGGTSDYIATSLAIQPHPGVIRTVLYSWYYFCYEVSCQLLRTPKFSASTGTSRLKVFKIIIFPFFSGSSRLSVPQNFNIGWHTKITELQSIIESNI